MSEIPTPSTPFSNGTESEAWMSKWCDYCANDHGQHVEDGAGCPIILEAMATSGTDDFRWPEPWLPEPDDGRFFLPSRMVCGMFSPCQPCGGDPGAEERAERVNEVSVYWRTRREAS